MIGLRDTQMLYSWQQRYQEAILETDPSRLVRLVALSKAAIDARLAELRSTTPADADEIQAIDNAQSALAILRKEVFRRAG
jgi:hypothetical protein